MPHFSNLYIHHICIHYYLQVLIHHLISRHNLPNLYYKFCHKHLQLNQLLILQLYLCITKKPHSLLFHHNQPKDKPDSNMIQELLLNRYLRPQHHLLYIFFENTFSRLMRHFKTRRNRHLLDLEANHPINSCNLNLKDNY